GHRHGAFPAEATHHAPFAGARSISRRVAPPRLEGHARSSRGSLMPTQTAAAPVADRIDALDWSALTAQLDERGFAQTEPVLDAAECAALAAQFDDGRFRSRVDMRRHRFGEGEYKYFDAPLPALVDAARHALYPPLAALANDWAGRLGEEAEYPAELDAFLARCHAAGQT